MTPRRPSFCVAVQAAPVEVMSATVVMPLERASSPPRTAESYQSYASRRMLRSMTVSFQEVYGSS